jgi:hypothetical protein
LYAIRALAAGGFFRGGSSGHGSHSRIGADQPQEEGRGSDQEEGADPKVWENYDFIPGSKVIFYTDFNEDKVGDFAASARRRAT